MGFFRSSFAFFDLCRVAPPLAIVLLLLGSATGQSAKMDEQLRVEKGKITLSIGDGFVFGESEPRSDEDRSKLDLYVQDIRHGASLAAFAGCTVPAQPMTSAGLPNEPSQLLGLLKDSPTNLPKRDLWLLPKCTSQRPGIGLIKSRSGKVYKLCLVKVNGHPEALKRTVQIAYESVPMVEGGGVLQLPKAKGQPDKETTASIRDALNMGALIPGDSFSRHIAGNYVAFATLIDRAVPEDDAHIALTKELNNSIKLENRGSVFAGKGIGLKGSVLLDAYGAIGVLGPMRGRGRTVDVHALRHSFGTLLSTSGIAPRIAQRAMRHSKIDLTMNTYTDPQLLDVHAAMNSLPSLDSTESPEQQKATGTDDSQLLVWRVWLVKINHL